MVSSLAEGLNDLQLDNDTALINKSDADSSESGDKVGIGPPSSTLPTHVRVFLAFSLTGNYQMLFATKKHKLKAIRH